MRTLLLLMMMVGCNHSGLEIGGNSPAPADLAMGGADLAGCKNDCDCPSPLACAGGVCTKLGRLRICECTSDADCTWFDTGCCFGECVPSGGQPNGPFCQTDCTAAGSCTCANGRCLLAAASDCRDASQCAPSLACCATSGVSARQQCVQQVGGGCPAPPP